MDALGNDDGIGIALHLRIAAGGAVLEVVPGDLHLFAVHQAADAADQVVHVHAIGGLPIRQLGGTAVKRQEEVIHMDHADLDTQVLQIVLQPQGGGGLAGAGGAGQRHHGAFLPGGENGGGCGADLIVKDLLAAQDELGLVPHGVIDVFQVDDSHAMRSFRDFDYPIVYHILPGGARKKNGDAAG